MKAKNCSIVIPAFNEEAAIKETVKRTLDSSPNAELILADESSTDGTWRHIEELMVVGTKFKNGSPKNASFLKSLANITGSFIASVIFQNRITDLSSGLRVINKKVAFLEIRARNLEYETELTSRVITNKMLYAEVPISVERRVGRSKLKFVQKCYLFMKAVIIGKYSQKEMSP